MGFGACIGTLFCSKKQPFKKVFRDGRTVDGKKGSLCPSAGVVDTLGKKFLAGSCFTVDHDR